jgi:hypothetical protein
VKAGRSTLIIFAVVFLVLAATAYFQQAGQNQPVPQAADVPFARVFPILTDSDIQAIRLEDPNTGAFLTLVRDAAGAWNAPDLPTALNPQTMDAIALTIALLPVQRILADTASGDLRAYGFDPAGTLAVQIVTTTGIQHGVIIGGLVATGEAYYALVDNTPDIYILERRAVDYLIVALRDRPTA